MTTSSWATRSFAVSSRSISPAWPPPTLHARRPKDRWTAGVTPTRRWATATPTTARRTPTSSARSAITPAGRRRRDRGGRCGRRRVLDGDVDRRLDRPPDRLRALPGQGLPGRRRSRTPEPVHRLHRVRHRPLRGGLDRQPDVVDHRQRLRLQGAQGAAPGGHADPGRLRQDVPGPAARHRHGARVPRQVRPAAAGRDRRSRSSASRPRTTAASSTRRCAAASTSPRTTRTSTRSPSCAGATATSYCHGGREAGRGRTGEIKGHDMNVTAATMEEMYERAEFAKEIGSDHHHDRPHHRLHGDDVDVEVGAATTAASSTSTGPATPRGPARRPTGSTSG